MPRKRKSTPPARVVGYCRVSTAGQADNGHSLDAQRERLEAYCVAHNLELVAVKVDRGMSAKSMEGRAGLGAALTMLRKGRADGLLVTKLDRLTRSLRDLGALLDDYFADKTALLSVGDQVDTRTASGRLVLNVLMSVSQWEREAIGERTSEVMQAMRQRGEYTGGRPPYGFELRAGKLRRVPAEQRAIALARRLRADGSTLRAIGAELERRGVLTRAGKPWGPEQVRCLLR